MKSHLKVKIFSLSAEMTYIRKQELKWKYRARLARLKQQHLSDPIQKEKAESQLSYAERNFWSQRWHRDDLKLDARIAHLAYGFMRGVPYSAMENICYGPIKGMGGSEPNWKAIEGTVSRFSTDEDKPQDIMQRFAEWLADAKAWYEKNPERIKELAKRPPLPPKPPYVRKVDAV